MRSDELDRVLFQVKRRLRALEGNAQEYLARERQLHDVLQALRADLEALRVELRGTEQSEIKTLTIEEELDRR